MKRTNHRSLDPTYTKRRLRKRIAIPVVIAIAVMCAGCATTPSSEEPAYTPLITDGTGTAVPGSIASLETVNINGAAQSILIRGYDTTQPVLLFLHGGPGITQMPWRELFITPELEREFVVVLWDQRGAGRSFVLEEGEEKLTVDQLVEDTVALTHYLCDRFDQDKIFMIGHSWGSALGFLTMMAHPEYPDLYHAYVASGEAADWNRRQTESFEWTLEQAYEHGPWRARRALEWLQPFDPTDRKAIDKKNEWLSRYGGEYHDEALFDRFREYLLQSEAPEYAKGDVRRWAIGAGVSTETIGTEALNSGYNLFRDLPRVDIPLYLFAGRYDYQTPSSIAVEYFESVNAPSSTVVWFENSAHYPLFAEPEKLTEELIAMKYEVLRQPQQKRRN